MIEYIKQNKWWLIIASFLIINIGYMVYSHEANKDVMQLQGNHVTLDQEVYEVMPRAQNEKIVGVAVNQQDEYKNELAEEHERINNEQISMGVSPEAQEEKIVPIYICGAIQNPGVYYMSHDAIINDVIEKGGGFTEEADQMAINLASPIIPNEKIIIPKIGEEIDKSTDSYDNRERIESSSVSPQADSSLNSVIDLNTATKEQLMTLNGIGEVKAAAIIAYRQEKGKFSSIEELKNISGIGEKTFEKIKQFITT